MRWAYIKERPLSEVGRFRFMVAAEENRAMANNLSPFFSSNEELGICAFKQVYCQGGVSHHFSNSLQPSRGNFVVSRYCYNAKDSRKNTRKQILKLSHNAHP